MFFEPSCLSAIREDAPALLRGDDAAPGAPGRGARACCSRSSLEQQLAEARSRCRSARSDEDSAPRPLSSEGHGAAGAGQGGARRACPARPVVDLNAGCCGMAGSFGYAREHYDVSRAIGERRLLPAARALEAAGGAGRQRRVVPSSGRRFRRDAGAASRRAPSVASHRRPHESGRHLRRRPRHRHHRQLLHDAQRRRAGHGHGLDCRRATSATCRSTPSSPVFRRRSS